jgi:hypothetical protein
LSAARAFLANEEGVVFVGCFSNFLLGCVRSCSRVHAATLQAISGAHIHRKHKGQWTVTEKISQVREEVRPVKSEIAIYNFRNFDLCKVHKFMVQNAPKSNILSKNYALLLMPKVTKNRYIFNDSN